MQRPTVSSLRSFVVLALMALSLATLACGFEGGAFGSTPTPGGTASVQQVLQAQALAMTPTVAVFVPNVAASSSGLPDETQTGTPVEALLITSPQPGQGVKGSIAIDGFSAANLNRLQILIRDAQGMVIGTASPTVQAQPDGRNKFRADVPLDANFPAQTGRVVVYAMSANNQLLHLASTEVQFNRAAGSAAAPIDPNTPEGIMIILPNPDASIQGTARVSAATMLGPDVVIEVRDAGGKIVGQILQKVDMTQLPAQILAEVPLQITQAGPGQILVYALNPRDGRGEHVSAI